MRVLPALHVQTAAIGHENLFFLLLDSSLDRRVVAAAGRVADHRGRRVPAKPKTGNKTEPHVRLQHCTEVAQKL